MQPAFTLLSYHLLPCMQLSTCFKAFLARVPCSAGDPWNPAVCTQALPPQRSEWRADVCVHITRNGCNPYTTGQGSVPGKLCALCARCPAEDAAALQIGSFVHVNYFAACFPAEERPGCWNTAAASLALGWHIRRMKMSWASVFITLLWSPPPPGPVFAFQWVVLPGRKLSVFWGRKQHLAQTSP